MAKRGVEALTDELAQRICEHLRAGHYRQTAAALVGIHFSTIAKWMGIQREPYTSFQVAVREAEAEAERVQLEKIARSVEPNDAKWYLARKFPDRWAETKRVDVTGRLDMGIKLNADALKDERARAHIIGLTDYLFTDGDSEPDSPGPDSEQ